MGIQNNFADVPAIRPDEAAYSQIADHIRRQVALNILHPGERLPAIRALADRLGLDPGTVARAYRELEREGIVVGRHGGGSYISAKLTEGFLALQQQGRLSQIAERYILETLALGFTTEEIAGVFSAHLADWRERRSQSAGRKRRSARRANEVRFMGSHDVAVELLASQVQAAFPEMHLATTFVGSLAGLVAVECRQAELAGTHLMDEETGEYNVSFVRKLMPNEAVVVMNLVTRCQGLMFASRNPKMIRGIEDVSRPDLTFVNRQKGSGTRILLDSWLRKMGISPSAVRGYEHEEITHTAVASLIAEGKADLALGVESAAAVAGLGFLPMARERYDLVSLKEVYDLLPMRRIQEVVCSDSYKAMVRSLTGYDVSDAGKIVMVGP